MLGRGLTGIAGDGVVLPTLPGNTGFSYLQQKTPALIIMAGKLMALRESRQHTEISFWLVSNGTEATQVK